MHVSNINFIRSSVVLKKYNANNLSLLFETKAPSTRIRFQILFIETAKFYFCFHFPSTRQRYENDIKTIENDMKMYSCIRRRGLRQGKHLMVLYIYLLSVLLKYRILNAIEI